MRRQLGSTVLTFFLALASSPAFAGERYTFSVERTGGLIGYSRVGHVLAEGDRYRVELLPNPAEVARAGAGPTAYDVLLSKDGGKQEVGVVLESRTFYNLKHPGPTPSTPLFRLFPMSGERSKVSKVKLEVAAQPQLETVSGLAARRHDIRLSYDITVPLLNERISGKVRLEASYWMAEDRSVTLPRMLRPEIHTGFPEIDGQLAAELAKLKGTPLKQSWTVSTEAEQSAPQSNTFTAILSGIEEAQVKPADFEVPAGFRYEEPVFVGPGAPIMAPPGGR